MSDRVLMQQALGLLHLWKDHTENACPPDCMICADKDYLVNLRLREAIAAPLPGDGALREAVRLALEEYYKLPIEQRFGTMLYAYMTQLEQVAALGRPAETQGNEIMKAGL